MGWKEWRGQICWDRKGVDRYSEDRMQRCPGSLGGGPQSIQQAILQQKLRIDQSGVLILAREAR